MFKNSALESHISDSGHQTHGEDRHNDKQKIIKTQYRNHGRFASGRLGIGTDCNYRIAVGWNARGRNLGFGRICSEKTHTQESYFLTASELGRKPGKRRALLRCQHGEDKRMFRGQLLIIFEFGVDRKRMIILPESF